MTGFLELADGRRVAVRDGLTIGRVGCDVVIGDTKASRKHAKIIVEGGVAEVEDLGSSNGTQLNGKPVTRRLLRSGDEIQIGTTVIRFVEGAMPAAAPAVAAPPPMAPPAAPARPSSTASDDDELFGGEATVSAPPPVVPPPPVRPVPPVPPPPPPPAAPPSRQVVEFADEVVEVKKPVRPEPEVAVRPASAPAAGGGIQQKQRVLQFSQNADTGNRLRDDLAQVSGSTKLLIYAAVLAGSAAIVWLIVQAMA